MEPTPLLVTCPRGLEDVLARELERLGGASVRTVRGAALAGGGVELGYRACLWSRVANRVLYPLASFPCPDADGLYEGVRAIDWAEHVADDGTIAVDFIGVDEAIRNSQFGAQRVKDAIVDRLRRPDGTRPSVDHDRPDLRVRVRLADAEAAVYVDLAGESLHRRGYRTPGHEAPLKENLAAGMLLLAGWEDAAAAGRPFLDPMCGTGTLPIEAGLIAAGVAPGLLGRSFGFERWLRHDAGLWQRLLEEARALDRRSRPAGLPRILGSDRDRDAVRTAILCLEKAGLTGIVHVERRPLEGCEVPAGAGVLVTNPPYGKRLGDDRSLIPTYVAIGNELKKRFDGWDAWILSGDPAVASNLGLKAVRKHPITNGGIDCRLLHYPIRARREPAPEVPAGGAASGPAMLANRLARRARHLGKWARRQGIDCYRVYDADIPEYAVAIDRYEDWVRIEEYEAPRHVDREKARVRLRQALSVVAEVLEVPSDRIVLEPRRAPVPGARTITVHEAGLAYLVDLADPAGSGLPLEHRGTRALVRELAAGRRFLDPFCRGGAMTVAAAAGGAAATTSIDASGAAIDRVSRNLRANDLDGPRHRRVVADGPAWLATQRGATWDLVYLEPPAGPGPEWEEAAAIRREHGSLIHAILPALAPGGILLFATGAKGFRLDEAALAGLSVRDLSRATLPPDFERRRGTHHLYRIEATPR